MGVKLTELAPKHEISSNDLSGKVIAIDAMNNLYQFLSVIRGYDGNPLMDSKNMVTSHLSGIFYRNANLLAEKIKLIYVFDGKTPEFKEKVQKERREIREEAYKKWQAALEKGDLAEARKYSQAAVKITGEMINESKELLNAMGIPVVQAPSEGEAQASIMAKKSIAYAVGSTDMDCLLFGAPRLVRNLNITGKRKLPGTSIFRDVVPEMIELGEVLKTNELTQEQLIIMGILIGTDYNPGGIERIGPKTALKIVKENKTLEAVLKKVEWNFDIDAKKIFDFFVDPPVEKEVKINYPQMDIEKIKEILVDRHEFSMDRVSSTLEKLQKLENEKKQKTLFSFK